MPARTRIRIPINQKNWMQDGQESDFVNDQPVGSFSDIVFGYLEEAGGEGSPGSSTSTEDFREEDEALNQEDDEKGNNNNGDVEEDKSFWENQHQLLQAALCRTSSLETSIRSITKETIKEMQMARTMCCCGRQMAGSCRNCLMREVSGRIRKAGYNSAICKSKWRSSPDIPSGEHTFLDVIENTNKGEVRVIVELNFQAEFEMAKANDHYNLLVQRLPEVFVGKVERLTTVIKILCLAAKKCMKEKKMHLGPWRKQRYMQAKWLGTCERTTSTQPLSMENSGRVTEPKPPRPRASMLTVDLLEIMPNIRRTAVEVV